MGKAQMGSYPFRNVQELRQLLHNAFTASQSHVTVVEDFDRMEVYEETLSDQSTVMSIRFTGGGVRTIPAPVKAINFHIGNVVNSETGAEYEVWDNCFEPGLTVEMDAPNGTEDFHFADLDALKAWIPDGCTFVEVPHA